MTRAAMARGWMFNKDGFAFATLAGWRRAGPTDSSILVKLEPRIDTATGFQNRFADFRVHKCTPRGEEGAPLLLIEVRWTQTSLFEPVQRAIGSLRLHRGLDERLIVIENHTDGDLLGLVERLGSWRDWDGEPGPVVPTSCGLGGIFRWVEPGGIRWNLTVIPPGELGLEKVLTAWLTRLLFLDFPTAPHQTIPVQALDSMAEHVTRKLVDEVKSNLEGPGPSIRWPPLGAEGRLDSWAQFVLDPWAKLERDYHAIAARRLPRRERWSRLLRNIVFHTMTRLEKRPPLHWMGYEIPPMPLVTERTEFDAQATSAPGSQTDVWVLTGEAGAGKTTFLEMLFNTLVDRNLYAERIARQATTPIFLPLRALSKMPSNALDVNYLVEAFRESHLHIKGPIGIGENLFWHRNSRGIDASLLRPLLLEKPLRLFIDGYDYLVLHFPPGHRPLRDVIRDLDREGVSLKQVLVSSRPGFSVETAIETRDLDAVKLKSPSDEILSEFVHDWCIWVADGLSQPPPPHPFEAFKSWVISSTEAPFGGTHDASGLFRNPLLSALLLGAFLTDMIQGETHDVGPLPVMGPAIAFEQLFLRLSGVRPDVETLYSHRDRYLAWGGTDRRQLEETSFRSLVSTRERGRIRLPTGLQKSVGVEQDERLSDLPFLSSVSPGSETFEFIHEAFHEYFTASCIAWGLQSQAWPTLESPISLRMAGKRHAGVRSPLLTTTLAIGRDAFRFFLCQLGRPGLRAGVEGFLDEMFFEIEHQQYLYDAGYLDRALEELLVLGAHLGVIKTTPQEYVTIAEANDSPAASGFSERSLVVAKFVAHIWYSDQETLALSLNLMRSALRLLEDSPTKNGLTDWYRVFFLDHISNREEREDIRRELVQQIELILGGPSTWRQKPSEQTLRLAMRAAHFAGHRGNQILKRISQSFSRSPGGGVPSKSILLEECSRGEVFYSWATAFRLFVLQRAQFPNQCEEILELLSDGSWTVPAYLEILSAADPDGEIQLSETCAGPSQVVGDIGNQLRGIAEFALYRAAMKPREEFTRAAEKAVELAIDVWRRAIRMIGDSDLGETVIKYYLYLCTLQPMLKMIRQFQETETIPTTEEALKQVEDELNQLEREAGVQYRRARQLGPRNVLAFRQALKNLGVQ